jgi:hypothetical protein
MQGWPVYWGYRFLISLCNLQNFAVDWDPIVDTQPKTVCPVSGFYNFPQPLQANIFVICWNKPQRLLTRHSKLIIYIIEENKSIILLIVPIK